MSEFLAMGGYAAYVWSAFGFAGLVLIGLLVQSWRAARRRDAELAQLRQIVRPSGFRRLAADRQAPVGAAGGDSE